MILIFALLEMIDHWGQIIIFMLQIDYIIGEFS